MLMLVSIHDILDENKYLDILKANLLKDVHKIRIQNTFKRRILIERKFTWKFVYFSEIT